MTWDASKLSSARAFRGTRRPTQSNGSRTSLLLLSSMHLRVCPVNTMDNCSVTLADLLPDILETNGIAWPNPQMWQRVHNNPALPVPTYYPDDGADSHSHSPRRRSYAAHSMAPSSVPMPTISSALHASSALTPNLNSFQPSLQNFQKSSTSSGASLVDPFSEIAYQDWINSLGLNSEHPTMDIKAVWPSDLTRNTNKQPNTDQSMPSMSDYLSSTMGLGMGQQSMDLSGPSFDDDTHMGSIKAPTNTPTTIQGGDPLATGELVPESLQINITPYVFVRG